MQCDVYFIYVPALFFCFSITISFNYLIRYFDDLDYNRKYRTIGDRLEYH